MQAVILAAGEGKRMQPLTLSRPKPLVEILGRPILEHIFDALPDTIEEIILVIGYKGEMIQDYFGTSYKHRPIRYVTQDVPKGTGHALQLARSYLTGQFLLMTGDDIHAPEALQKAVATPLALVAAEYADPSKMGVIALRENGALQQIVEKPEFPIGNLVSTGAMVLDERIFEYEPVRQENGEYYITHPLQLLANDHAITVIRQPLWIPVGSPQDISIAEELLASGIEGKG